MKSSNTTQDRDLIGVCSSYIELVTVLLEYSNASSTPPPRLQCYISCLLYRSTHPVHCISTSSALFLLLIFHSTSLLCPYLSLFIMSATTTTRKSINRSSTSSSADNPYVQLAIDRATSAAQHIQAAVQASITRAQALPPQHHAITLASSFLLAIFFRYISMHKEDSLITIGLLVNVLLFTAISTAVQGLSAWQQYSGMVVFFEVMRFLHLVHNSPLLMATLPLLIDQVRIGIIETVRKAKK